MRTNKYVEIDKDADGGFYYKVKSLDGVEHFRSYRSWTRKAIMLKEMHEFIHPNVMLNMRDLTLKSIKK